MNFKTNCSPYKIWTRPTTRIQGSNYKHHCWLSLWHTCIEKVKTMLRNVCACIGLVLLVLVIIIAIRTTTFSVRSDSVRSCRLTDNDFIRATDEVIGRFQSALRFRTISTNLHQYDRAELQKMVDFVQSGDTFVVWRVYKYGAPLQSKSSRRLRGALKKYFFFKWNPGKLGYWIYSYCM